MKRFFSPLVLILTLIILLTFCYSILSLDHGIVAGLFLFIPFLLVWTLPVVYWGGTVKRDRPIDMVIHIAGYLSMAWLSFFLFFLLIIDLVSLFSSLIRPWEVQILYGATTFAMVAGLIQARYGPGLRKIQIPLRDLSKAFVGYKIIHITDLHVGPTIGYHYVDRVVQMTKSLNPDLIVLTGDLVDGSPEKLSSDISPLKELGALGNTYLSLGNHDYYSGCHEWTKTFREMGIKVLINEHVVLPKENEQLIVAGITDPAAKTFDPANLPDAKKAMTTGSVINSTIPSVKILLAHNPKLAEMAAQAGFDLMLSGHTHAGQFLPWTLVVKLIHRPHCWGLSKEGLMSVYVGAGTGTWGPPIRFGTKPELTLLTLIQE